MKHIFSNSNESAVARNSYRCATLALPLRKVFFTLSLLLTLGVGQMWADNGDFYNMYIAYSFEGAGGAIDGADNNTGVTVDAGTLTSGSLTLTGVYLKCWDDWGANYKSSGGQLCYTNKGGSTQYISCTRSGKSGNNYEFQNSNPGVTLASYNQASGSYSFVSWGQTWGDNWGDRYFPKSSGNYTINYKIAPPAVSGFTITPSGEGYVSGTGTESDPYIMKHDAGNLVLTMSGSKAHTDANSSAKYYNGSSWSATATKTIAYASGSTTKKSITLKMKYNNSTASLDGAESSIKVYYQRETAYTVSKYSGGSVTGGSFTATSPAGAISGSTVTATPSTGYNFSGWSITSGSGTWESSTSTASNTFYPASNSTIKATFTAKTTTVTLNANAPGGQTVTGGGTTVTATYNALLPSFSALTCTGGYALKGYYDAASNGNKIINADGSFNANSGYWNRTDGATLTLYAQWSLDRTLTYSGNGNTSGSVPAAATTYANGTNVTVLGNTNSLAKTGYTFNGWNTEPGGGGTAYAASSSITMNANYTLYAQWSENDYTVTVTAGSNGSVASGSVTGHIDTKVTLPTATPNTGYHFSTWTTTSGSVTYTNQTSATEAQVNGLTAVATVRADFAANTYSVAFNKNGGTGTMSNEAFTYDAAAKALTSNSFTKSGYTFIGWATSSERASALTVDYTDGQSVRNLTSTNGGTFTLYAVWVQKYYIGGRFQHDWEEGSATTNEMTYDASTGYYKFETSKTVNELSVQWHNVSGNYDADQYFYIHTGLGKGATSAKPTYVGASSNGHDMEVKIGYANAYVLTKKTSSFDSFTDAMLLKFSNTDNLSSAVIVWWDPANKKVWYTATESLNTNYYLLGFGSGSWSETDARRFKVASVNATTATVSVSLTAKTYTYNTNDGFKVENGGTYYSNNSTMTRDNCTGWSFTTGTNNCGITADLAGTYTFTLNLSTMVVSVTYPTAYQLNYAIGDVNGGDGSISSSPSTSSGSYVGSGNSVTLTAPDEKTGYTWKGWYGAAAGTGEQLCATKAYAITMNANKTVYACYTINNHAITHSASTHGSYTIKVGSAAAVSTNTTSDYGKTITLAATPATGYHFGSWSAYKTGTPATTVTVTSNQFTMPDYAVTVGATFTPNTYRVQFHRNGGAGVVVYQDFTYDAAQNLTANTYTRTGYTFAGWATAADGSVVYTDGQSVSNLSSTQGATVDLYAKWTAKTYTVTLDVDEDHKGTIAGAATSQTVTYDATPTTIANRPTAEEGYGLDGYYTGHNGAGTKLINGDGTWVASVAGYTDASSHWIHDGDVTLYAYYKMAEITIELEEAIVAPWTEESPSTVTATPTLSPRPEGDTKICWFLLQNNNNPVEPQPSFTPGEGNSVSFPAPTVSGNYKVVATLRTGTSCDGGTLLDADTVVFTVAGEHTVTIMYKCGDDVIKASTTSPGKPLEGTSITAPDIIGYSFHHWVLGDGVTLASGTAGSAGSAGTATISYTAIYDGHITAVYTKRQMVYFNNTLGWSDVYVYFYNDGGGNQYWADNYGTGANKQQEFGGNKPYWEMEHGHMTQIEGTNIWYFDFKAAAWYSTTRTKIAFANKDQSINKSGATNAEAYFHNASVVYRADFDATNLPMFVPINSVEHDYTTNTGSKYYRGYWMNYPENTGYWLKIFNKVSGDPAPVVLQDIPFEFNSGKTMPMSLTVELEANRTYGFKIYRKDATWYGNSGTMKINASGDEGQAVWEFTTGASSNCGLKTSVAGDYIFKLNYGEKTTGNFYYLVGVHYPVAANDYRIVYNDLVKWSHSTAHNADAPWHHPSRAIHKENGAKDTVSFYVSKAAGASASMKFQYASAISNEGVVTWADVAGAGGTIDLSSIENSGVYNFILTQSAGSISVEKIEPYTGAYYIRTDCAGSTKWDNYRAADHQMTYSEFSKSRETNKFGDLFSHYYTKWCPRGTNIKFCIANDYSSCVSDTLIRDDAFPGDVSSFPENADVNGTLKNHGESDEASDPYSANIRFMYDESTNRIKRAYVAAATNVSKKFLVLQGDDKLTDKNGNAIPATAYLEKNAVLFQDDQNWIYETTVKAIPGARVRIYAMYLVGVEGTGQQFFVGASGDWADERTIELLGGSGSTPMLVRVIYDFKTNRLVCAWMPDGSEIEGDNAINADIMVIREHQDAAQTITFKNDESKLSKVKTVYGAMKFNRWILNNRQHPEDVNPDHCRAGNIESDLSTYHRVLPPAEQKSIYERSLYFISFPFRVKLSEVFGFGKYWDEWYIEYYDGETRAKNGYWKDSPPNWKYVTTDMLNSFYLEPNVGYILGLDLDYMQAENTTFWANGISNVELYFPSQESIETIGRTAVTMPALGDAYLCTIHRGTTEGDRRVKDSYWRCIGVPGYSSYNNTLTVDGSNEFSWQTNTTWRENFKDYPFLYEWNMTDNTLTAQSTNRYNFKAMHAYLVQNGNEIHWSAISATPVSPIVARERAASQSEYMWRLTMECDGQEEDQAFIRMTDEEDVTDGFDFGQDLVKEYNYQRSDLYTYIGYERAAANSMPLHTEETTSIPVGVSIEKGGEYTFAMPDGTSGVGITLIDSETGAQTNLSAGFTYTVNFEKGDYNNRLYLEISPVSQISTGVDEVPSDHVQGTKARKVVIDGLLYIVKDGQMYDATGKHCK